MNNRRYFVRAIVCVVAFHFSSAASEPGMITDVRAAVRPHHSRLTFFFRGSIRFSCEYRGNTVALQFGHTQLALPWSAEELRFNSGPVERVIVSRMANEGIEMSVIFREKASYSLVRPHGQNVLHMDVVSEAWSERARHGTAALARSELKGTSASPAVLPLAVNIPAVAWDQSSGMRNNGSRSVNERYAKSKADSQKSIPLYIFACAVLTGLLGTGALLYLVSTSRPKRIVNIKLQNDSFLPKPDSADDPRADVTALKRDQRECDTEPRPVSNFSELAQHLLCNRDEVEFAFTLQKEGLRHSSIDKLHHIPLRHVSTAQRVKAARKLDIGMGELELAMRLKQLQHANAQKEEFA